MTKDKTLLSMGGTECSLNLQMFAEVDNPYINEIENNLSITGSLAEEPVARFYTQSVPLYGDHSQTRLTVEFYDVNTDESIDYVDWNTVDAWPANINVRARLHGINTLENDLLSSSYYQRLYLVLAKRNDPTKTPIVYYNGFGSGQYTYTDAIDFNDINVDILNVLYDSGDITLGEEYEICPILVLGFDRTSSSAPDMCPQYLYDDVGIQFEISNTISSSAAYWFNWKDKIAINSRVCIPFCGKLNPEIFYEIDPAFENNFRNNGNTYNSEYNIYNIALWTPTDIINSSSVAPVEPDANIIIANIDNIIDNMVYSDRTKCGFRYGGISGVDSTSIATVSVEIISTAPIPGSESHAMVITDNDFAIRANARSALDIACKYANKEIKLVVSTNGSY